jgi:hypothetical protein
MVFFFTINSVHLACGIALWTVSGDRAVRSKPWKQSKQNQGRPSKATINTTQAYQAKAQALAEAITSAYVNTVIAGAKDPN